MAETDKILNKTIEKGRKGLEAILNASKEGYSVNEKLLFKLLEENKNTEFGKKYGFDIIKTVEEYQKRVPLSTYGDYEEYINRIENGEKDVITSRDIEHFALSSGSSGKPKKVPMCGEAADLFALYTHGACFAVMDSELKENWVKGRGVSLTEIRFTTDVNGFTYGAVSGKVRERNKAYEKYVYTTPLCVTYPKCSMDFLYMHLRFALMERDLSYITCTFMTAAYDLMRYFENNWRILAEDIKNGTINEKINVPESVRNELKLEKMPQRAKEIEKECLKGFEGIIKRIWPNAAFVFGIGSESFKIYTERMRFFLGGIKVHYSVFSASEGIFACPLRSESDEMLLIPFSAFYEFKDIKTGEITALNKVSCGRRYELIITNLSGFYRYRMMDIVEVTGFYNKLPKIRFVYRLNQVLNIAGEKTNDSTMKDAVINFDKETGKKIKEYTVYADKNSSPGRYVVFAEFENEISPENTEKYSFIMEKNLRRLNLSYAEKIRAGKLQSLVLVPLQKGTYSDYAEMMSKKGVSVNQLKPVRVADSDEKAEFFIKHMAHGCSFVQL